MRERERERERERVERVRRVEELRKKERGRRRRVSGRTRRASEFAIFLPLVSRLSLFLRSLLSQIHIYTHLKAGTIATTGLASRVKTAPWVAAEAGAEKESRRSSIVAAAAARGSSGDDDGAHRCWRRRWGRRASLANAIAERELSPVRSCDAMTSEGAVEEARERGS